MIPEFYLFALLSAVFFGLEPIMAKKGLASGGTWLENTLVVLVIRVLFFWAGFLVLSGGTGLFSGLTVGLGAMFAFASVISSGFGRISFYMGVERTGSTTSNAVTNLRPLFAVLFGAILLDEPVSLTMALGAAVLVGGLVLITFSGGGDVRGWRPVALLFPLLAGFTFAAGNVMRRFGFEISTVGALEAITIGETAAFLVIIGYTGVEHRRSTRVFRGPRDAYRYFAGSGVLAGGGLLALFFALERGPVSIVDPLSSLAPLVTVGAALVLLGDLERITRRLVLGTLLVVIGIAFVT